MSGIEFVQGDLLEADVEALVNAVNTVGVMGKGIALQFKFRYPENYRRYSNACAAGEVRAGELLVTESPELVGPRWIINFATKKHWRDPSRIEWIESGLGELRTFLQREGVGSVALPALGCGNGGLGWHVVKPILMKAFDDLAGVRVLIYEPL